MYDVVYDQKVEDGIAYRTKNGRASLPARITIQPYSNVLSAESTEDAEQHATNELPRSFAIVSEDIVSRVITERKYDAIVCATGYQRTSWMNLLKSSNIGKRYGLHSASPSHIRLIPSTERSAIRYDRNLFEMEGVHSETPSPSTGSSISTPPTSPGPSAFSSLHLNDHIANEVYISRSYRLLPANADSEGDSGMSKPRIYLQGVEETTHGLSDTLLSVLGVRAGEVVTDLWNRDTN